MQETLLIGTGKMARAYAAVLNALNMPTVAVGRSKAGTHKFVEETGIAATPGGIAAWKKSAASIPSRAIITVDVVELAAVAAEVVDVGCKDILLEKPGALTRSELVKLQTKAAAAGVRIYIAYNRRFCASTLAAQKCIEGDGGEVSYTFEFNERLTQRQTLKELGVSEKVQQEWFIANSTHVVDLAFYLGGSPREIRAFTAAGPLWAPHPTLFAGAGITEHDVPFSYYSNWELPGPWSVIVGTKKRNIILQPLESLAIEENGVTVAVDLADELDKKYKPGLYVQVKAFLDGTHNLLTLDQQIAQFKWFDKILGS